METNIYPFTHRRLRTGSHMRELTASVTLSHKSFIQPLFVEEGISKPRSVKGLTGIMVETPDSALYTIEHDLKNGCSKLLLFPVPSEKEETNFDFSFSASVVKRIKETFGNSVWLATDLCLCSFTTHGHCGILNKEKTQLSNHKTVEVLSIYASQLAVSGTDCIAPSDMMDGRIAALRSVLNAMGKEEVSIMSYSAKFSSQFYGPFRDACHSSPDHNQALQNRKTYQISPFNANDGVASALRDEKEGADILMVKPAVLYSDIITKIKQQALKPVAAYHVSGEYAALESLADQGLVNREMAHVETWTALKRSGADIIISYVSRNAKTWIERIDY